LWLDQAVGAKAIAADCLERRVPLVERSHIFGRFLFPEIKGSIVIALVSRHLVILIAWRWGFSLRVFAGDRSSGCAIGVVRLAVHVLVLCNALLPRLAADQRAPHGTRNDAACDDDYGGAQDNPSSPGYVWNEKQNVDQESEQ
jgi:hypothetical protein